MEYVETQWVRQVDEEPEVTGFVEVMEPNSSEGHKAVDTPDEHLISTNSTEQRLNEGTAASVMIWLFNKSLSYLSILSYLEGHILSGRSHLILEG